MKKYTKSEIEGMIKSLEAKEKKARSKWGKAVLQDAQWLLENVIEGYDEPYELSEKLVLNGASDWKQFSLDGSGLIYDAEIAEHYSTPSELKKVGFNKENMYVEKQPNANEEWLDIQARALRQAWWAIRDEMKGTTEFSMSLCEFEEKKGKSNFDMDNPIDEYWGLLIEYGIATEDELQLITSINGYTGKTLNDVLYTRTGYRSWEQYCEANDIENEDEDEDNFDLFGSLRQTDYYETGKGRLLFSMVFDSNNKEIELYTIENGKKNIICRAKNRNNMPILIPMSDYRDYVKVDSKLEKDFEKFVRSCDGFSNFSIIEDTKDVIKATGKLAGNIVKNTTDKGGLLMF